MLAARYFAGLRQDIQDDLSTIWIWTVEEVYQFALLNEEKLKRKATAKKPTFTPRSTPTPVISLQTV